MILDFDQHRIIFTATVVTQEQFLADYRKAIAISDERDLIDQQPLSRLCDCKYVINPPWTVHGLHRIKADIDIKER